ncbi:MAG: hypothetical protein ABIF10_00565, partial [Candidatus Woesearchaeota archaeon]
MPHTIPEPELHMKTLITIIAMLLAVSFVAGEIKMDVIQYNQETQKARIIVANTGPQDYHDITFALDDMAPTEYKGSLFKAGTAITIPKIVPQGIHIATVTTREGEVFSQEMLFAPSGKQILPESIRIKNKTTSTEPPIIDTGTEDESRGAGILILLIILIIAGGAGTAYWYFKRNHSAYSALKQKITAIKNKAIMYTQKITGKKPGPQAYSRMTTGQRQQPRQYQRPGQYPRVRGPGQTIQRPRR